MKNIDTDVIGTAFGAGKDNKVSNAQLVSVNNALRKHPVELVGARLRASMTAMKPII
jgi:ketol-acid reductoisomerase